MNLNCEVVDNTLTTSPLLDSGFPPKMIRFLGKKWVVLILRECEKKKQVRFRDLKVKFGITSKVLSEVLREMKDMGFVNKSEEKSFPPIVTYTLSKRGLDLLDRINHLEDL